MIVSKLRIRTDAQVNPWLKVNRLSTSVLLKSQLRSRFISTSLASIKNQTLHPLGAAVDLSFERFGNPSKVNPPMIILHGLFGSKQNWRSIAKRFAEVLSTEVYTLDLRNHGESPSQVGSNLYLEYAGDVQNFVDQRGFKSVNIIGHSLGGKVAMIFSILKHLNQLSNPDTSKKFTIPRLIVVDISPAKLPLPSSFESYVKAMKAINAEKVSSRSQADEILSKYESDPGIRAFLLTNLISDPTTKLKKIRLPLEIIESQMNNGQVTDFPFSVKTDEDLKILEDFDIKALFIKGIKSNYINPQTEVEIKKFFKNSKVVDVDAGHWVQADKPIEFMELVSNFIKK
ncbi:alpha/beta hydrolase [Phakopsora pachyrhizi]|nr:alpha/beta hydrolase [Phakopsora pachyrhizi]